MNFIDSSGPLVSIITPVYNAQRHLGESVSSVLQQTHRNWELLLVVDCKSSDASYAIAREFELQDPRIRVISDPECVGVSRNRNRGLDASKGHYIAFLDADDQWMPEKLSVQLDFMQKTCSPISYHSFYTMDEYGQRLPGERKAKYRVGYQDLLKNNCIGCLTVMLERNFLGNNRFEDIRHEDLFLWLSLLERGDLAAPINKILAIYRINSKSLSGNKITSAMWRWQIYRKIGLSTPTSIYYMFTYALFAAKKRINL